MRTGHPAEHFMDDWTARINAELAEINSKMSQTEKEALRKRTEEILAFSKAEKPLHLLSKF
jgi:hypothetical protein